jgi:transformation/transcription domain-associated protein
VYCICETFQLFQFLRDFLENVVAQSYTIEWKRSAFFRFVEHFPNPSVSQELKSKILQMVLIPCFAQSFERGEGEKLVGSPAAPDQDNPDNVVSVFISKVRTYITATLTGQTTELCGLVGCGSDAYS